MKRKAWIVLSPFLVAVLLGCNRSPQDTPLAPKERIFDVKGVVREIQTTEKMIVIEHETIPGYMDSMTMPFSVKDTNLLAGIAVDNTVKFQLVVTDTDAWVSTIATIGTANATNATTTTNEVPSLKGGDDVPDFTLTDQDGRSLHLKDFRGKPVVLTFIFTRCPLPTFCPLMTRNFFALEKELTKDYGDQFHLISITIDPEHDTPKVLKEYAENFASDFKTWSFATGTPEQIKSAASLFGLTYQPEDGSITHTLRTALIDQHGRLVHIWKSNVWQPSEVLTMVREIVPRS